MPNNTLFSKEALDPIMIEIGRIENSIIGIFVLMIFIFYLKTLHAILFDL